MQILGVAFVLFGLLVWNSLTGGLEGFVPLAVVAAGAWVLLTLGTRTRRPHRLTVVLTGIVLTAAGTWLWQGTGHDGGELLLTAAALGAAAGSLVPLPRRRAYR